MHFKRKLGWKRQAPDERDFKMRHFKMMESVPTVLPPVVNLRRYCSEIQDQGELGSCTANAWAGMMQYNLNRNWDADPSQRYFDFSRLFIYYNERILGGTVGEDSGAYLRDGAKALATWGAPPEYTWPYFINNFAVKPIEPVYKLAYNYHIHSYYNLDSKYEDKQLNNLKFCIASGHPFVFGFMVFDSFETEEMKNTGIMPMPDTRKESIQGGHAVMGVGYNDYEKRFLIRNSWGKGWGLKGTNAGYFTMPYEFISKKEFASDFWTLIKND